MTAVFIGGSRAVSRLNSVIRAKLDELIGRNCEIFVGDANGADKAVQQHLADCGYRNVVVYCMDRCRNNVGKWTVRHVARPGPAKDFAYYVAKDLAMAVDAKCGIMLWDGRSKGTLNNIQNLVSSGKKALVYFAPERVFHKLTSEEDFCQLLNRCNRTEIETAQRRIRRKIGSEAQFPLGVARF